MTTDITELAQRVERIISDMKLKHGDKDTYAPIMKWDEFLALLEALERAPQAPIMPLGLHPDTQKLVTDFCTALAEKLYKAQLKYGYDADWKQDGWPTQCQAHFHQHIAKGDPRDVAAYCAFMWWHGWSTKPAECLESRTVALPDMYGQMSQRII